MVSLSHDLPTADLVARVKEADFDEMLRDFARNDRRDLARGVNGAIIDGVIRYDERGKRSLDNSHLG